MRGRRPIASSEPRTGSDSSRCRGSHRLVVHAVQIGDVGARMYVRIQHARNHLGIEWLYGGPVTRLSYALRVPGASRLGKMAGTVPDMYRTPSAGRDLRTDACAVRVTFSNRSSPCCSPYLLTFEGAAAVRFEFTVVV